MNVKANFSSRFQMPLMQWSSRPLLRLIGCIISIISAQYLVIALNRPSIGHHVENQIWIANGILLSYLLLAPRWHWKRYLAAGTIALLILAMLLHYVDPVRTVFMTSLNLIEVFVSAWLLRRKSRNLPAFTNPRYLIRFAIVALLIAPATAGLIHALFSAFFFHQPILSTMADWIMIDAFGTAAVTPACIAIFSSHYGKIRLNQSWIYLVLLGAAVVTSHFIPGSVVLSVIYPILLLILVNFGLPAASTATIFVAAAYAWNSPYPTDFSAAFRLQLFVGTTMFLLYCVSIVLDHKKEAETRLQEIAELHREVTEYSRDALILSDTSFRRLYVSSATEKMGGWTREEVYTHNSVNLLHPDDLPRVQMALKELYKNDVAMIEARIKKKDGNYLWVEASLRVIRDQKSGQIHRILNIVRDISERKQSERKLQEAYNAVEALAVTDSLTGLANRRRFDQYIGVEWRRSARDQQPLSVLMLDADHFKSYNDTYGHQRGDSCLKQIGEACMDVVSRPGDLVARFGGEEFVVILPNTENAGALLVAEEIIAALRSRRLPHSGNRAGIVTISIGCATMVPRFSGHPSDLIELADRALYQAKHEGRDRVCNGNAIEEAAPVTL